MAGGNGRNDDAIAAALTAGLKFWLGIKGMVVMVRKTKEKRRSGGLIVS